MAAVFAEEERVRSVLEPYADSVSIAAINGPKHVVVSGAADAVRAVLKDLESQGITTQSLAVSHAFHSPLMEPMLDAFAKGPRRRFATLRRASRCLEPDGRICQGRRDRERGLLVPAFARARSGFRPASRRFTKKDSGFCSKSAPTRRSRAMGKRCFAGGTKAHGFPRSKKGGKTGARF